jgi:hypothetical protein
MRIAHTGDRLVADVMQELGDSRGHQRDKANE